MPFGPRSIGRQAGRALKRELAAEIAEALRRGGLQLRVQHVDDHTVLRHRLLAGEGLHEEDRRRRVHVHQELPGVERQIGKTVRVEGGRGIDQHRHRAAERVRCLGDQLSRGFRPAQVLLQERRPAADGTNVVGKSRAPSAEEL
jgi:hypothetical protein